ncbi:MAG: glycerophosphodiester phosphodiesterase family protein [Marinicellaceae bacterium]
MSLKILAKPTMIAHAGGGFEGKRYTNSLEALDESYAKGFRLFEIDFSWTSDNQLVCLHDWEKSFKRNFGFKTKQPINLLQFQQLLDEKLDNHPCTLSSLAKWAASHPDSKIITDVKLENIAAISLIVSDYPALKDYLIPQFYQPEEYKVLRKMGFENLIWILYQFEGKKSSIKNHAKNMNLMAISMRSSQAKKKWAQQLIKQGHEIFVYTINKNKKLIKLTQKYGVTGIYTDFLPHKNSNNRD